MHCDRCPLKTQLAGDSKVYNVTLHFFNQTTQPAPQEPEVCNPHSLHHSAWLSVTVLLSQQKKLGNFEEAVLKPNVDDYANQIRLHAYIIPGFKTWGGSAPQLYRFHRLCLQLTHSVDAYLTAMFSWGQWQTSVLYFLFLHNSHLTWEGEGREGLVELVYHHVTSYVSHACTDTMHCLHSHRHIHTQMEQRSGGDITSAGDCSQHASAHREQTKALTHTFSYSLTAS